MSQVSPTLSDMAKTSTSYVCSSCGATHLRWVGRCSKCAEFGTVAESATTSRAPGVRSKGTAPTRTARPIGEVSAQRTHRQPTGVGEFDRVLGGGLVPGQVVLVAGEPGVGKSTLLLAVAHEVAARPGSGTLSDAPVLYVTGEESAEQVGIRAERIGAMNESLLVADETDIQVVLGHIREHHPRLVVIDSVQTMASPEVDGRPGGVAQVLEVTQALTRSAKERGVPLLLVGQSTRENTVAGPRALEHLVDTVVTFEGDRASALRLLRASKNRYGPADEVAAFEQTENGLRQVLDPSELFRGHRDVPVPGTCVAVTMEGRRAIVNEIQALVATTTTGRRTVTGLDPARVTMLAAVIDRISETKIESRDLFVATVGGARIIDPAADLAVCLATASALRNVAVPGHVLAIGEVALSGDIRPVQHLQARVNEARRLGFTRILVPTGSRSRLDSGPSQEVVTELDHINLALGSLDRIALQGY